MGRMGGGASKRTTFGLLAALAVILVIFYFVTAGKSSSDDSNKTSKANAGNGQATSSLFGGEEGTSEPTSWSSTETPTMIVFDADAYDWDELPPFAQSAASSLGYDRSSWDADSLSLPPWSNLSLQEKEAAMALGYDPGYWNEYVATTTTDVAETQEFIVDPDETRDHYDTLESSTFTPTDIAWDGLDWDELPPEIRDAAGRLGYDERTWEDDDAVFSGMMNHWIDLTPEMQAAVKTLGWDEQYWEDVVYRGPPEPITDEPTTWLPTTTEWMDQFDDEFEEDDEFYDDDEFEEVGFGTGTVVPSTETSVFEWLYASYEWEELPTDVRESAELLGWNELTWCDGDRLPLRRGTRFVDLTDAQKVAAAALGFSERTWDDVPDDDDRRFLRQRRSVA